MPYTNGFEVVLLYPFSIHINSNTQYHIEDIHVCKLLS